MASKKRSGGSRKPSKAKAKSSAKTQGDHVRLLANKNAVRSFISDVIATQSQTSTIGQELSSATKRAQNAGVNIPAARLATRFVKKAKADAGAARVMYEDFCYYLEECMEFDKIAPPGMFSADETRSTKNGKAASTKRNPRKGAQTDIEQDTALADDGGESDTSTAVEAQSEAMTEEASLH